MNREFLKNETLKLCALCGIAAADGARIVITGHDMPDSDSIISAVMLRELLARLGVASSVKFGTRPDNVTERDMTELGVRDGVEFGGFEDSDVLVLVDHHVTFYKNEVIGCVDHHTTPPEPDFRFNLVRKASSCGRVIFDMACACGVADEELEKMAICSVYLDTQSCRSPKFDQADRTWLDEGIARLGMDGKRLEKMGFCLVSPDETVDVLAMYAYKRYEFDGRLGASTCIQIDESENGWNEKIHEIIDWLCTEMVKEDTVIWALVVNKPAIMKSDVYFLQNGKQVEVLNLDRLASRSRDVIPVVKAARAV